MNISILRSPAKVYMIVMALALAMIWAKSTQKPALIIVLFVVAFSAVIVAAVVLFVKANWEGIRETIILAGGLAAWVMAWWLFPKAMCLFILVVCIYELCKQIDWGT